MSVEYWINKPCLLCGETHAELTRQRDIAVIALGKLTQMHKTWWQVQSMRDLAEQTLVRIAEIQKEASAGEAKEGVNGKETK